MRFAFLFLLALAACDADTFVDPDAATDGGRDDVAAIPDGGASDGDADAIVSETGPVEASAGDAAPSIECNGAPCDQVCCGGAGAWATPNCAAASTENNALTCTNWLACDDRSDCPGGQYCCATQNSIITGDVLNSSYCAPNCFATAGAFGVCTQTSDCQTGSCKPYTGDPSWVKTCQ